MMASPGITRLLFWIIVGASTFALINGMIAGIHLETGSIIPAEARPCVDCHAFEFIQRALQDLKNTVHLLDSRTETLLLKAEKRGLCDCLKGIR